MDDFIASGDYENAVGRGIQALKLYDEEREFENSIQVLEKLVTVAEIKKNKIQAAIYVDFLRVRALLARDQNKYNEINRLYSNLPETPISQIMKESDPKTKHIIVETIEKQDIFGEFSALEEIPYLTFEHQDEVVKIVEDFFEDGRYLLNLLDTSTSLHQAVSVDIGQPEEVNIVDRDHVFKIQ